MFESHILYNPCVSNAVNQQRMYEVSTDRTPDKFQVSPLNIGSYAARLH